MFDALLPYFNRELGAVRRLAAEFAQAHPKIAGRLRLSADAVDDPHVARLLDGVAFLAARVQHRLDDEFPELTDALLGVLYPHYLAPVPPCAMIQLTPQPDLVAAFRLPRGSTIDAEPVHGQTCRFRSAYDVTLWPIEIDVARLSGLPFQAPPNPKAARASAVLRIGMRCLDPALTFTQLGMDRLRVFLRGPSNVTQPLYELLCANTLAVAFANDPTDAAPVLAPASVLQPAGFAPEESLLPWSARSFSGFRLLTEYFALPEKFLFFDILGLDAKTLLHAGNRLEIFVYLDRTIPDLERLVEPATLALGCTPIVNLFPQRCEPIPLTHTELDYRVVPDMRRQAAMEVWSVERVRETRPDGARRGWRPFYRLAEAMSGEPELAPTTYQVIRRASTHGMRGSDVFLAPHDPDFDPHASGGAVLSVDALCFNRDLAAELPFGGGHPRLQLVEGAAGVARIACLTAPTPTLRPPLREQGFWRLVSHLSLGHLSVVGDEKGAIALKEILRLYDLRASAETRGVIEALVGVSSAPGTARAPGTRGGAFCRGLDVTLEFDPNAWAGGAFLLAAVLERFLALHATVNAFVRTSVRLRGSPDPVTRWPARAGARTLL